MTKLYKMWNGKLEVVDLIDAHHLCDGATKETYLIRDEDGRKSTVSKDMFHETREAALENYGQDLIRAIAQGEEMLVLKREEIEGWKKENDRIQAFLKDIRSIK